MKMAQSTVLTMERRMDALERRMNQFRAELHDQRNDFREWIKQAELRLQKKRQQRRGCSRRRHPREESEETEEPATVKKPIAIRKSKKVEKMMEKNLGNLKLKITDVAESVKHVEDELSTQQQKIEKGAFQWSDDNDNINVIAADAGDFHAPPPEPPEPPDNDSLTVVAWPSYKSGGAFFSLVTGERYSSDEEPKWDSGDGEPNWDSENEEPSPEEE